MPIYEYVCKSCEHGFDALQKMSDEALVECPECGQSTLRKLLSAPKFRLAGKGWYETDFKTGDKRNIAGEADKSDKPKDGEPKKSGKSKDGEPKKGDSKVAAATTAKASPKPTTDGKAGTT